MRCSDMASNAPLSRVQQLLVRVTRRSPVRELDEAIRLIRDGGDELDSTQLERLDQLVGRVQARRPARELRTVLATLSDLRTS